ncbi:MAG: CRISPR-associated helicase Cas3' [Evtepia sp.]|uniref:CRISPR-associated helicase Cas3' n=1 Tax=Evtepia sp. TaxID=2773933 RepID=UPI002A7561E6|nr:CRISPR-associated helicase Cas3' [Evtepia sp.]MDY3013971.1 CRISPR-associated helicase Cas3' [Evtepia sp.]
MESSPYLAHLTTEGQSQSVLEHLHGTASLAKDFARPFGGEEQAELAGLAHDIGKYSTAFQKRLLGGARVDHSTAGTVECFRRRQMFAAFAVAGHHGGLPNGGNRLDGAEQATFWGRIKRGERGMLEPYDRWVREVALPQAGVPDFVMKKSGLELMFFTRMLYSCLVDADFLDTEAFMEGQRREACTVSIDDLWERLQSYISGWFPPKGELNCRRCEILERCMREGEGQLPGLFSLTVPTGGGKTVASLAFALAHAKKHGLRRVIYVIPYTSIIEQTAEVFRSILGTENVLDHHSNRLYDLEGEASPETVRLAKATENWDMPVIVTTAVQFFESLYACRSSQCRKLHHIAGSVVIFDEAQMMPIPYLRPCVWAISQLVKNYGVSAVLCTATQPALKPRFQEFLPSVPVREICLPETCQWEVFRRTIFRKEGHLTWEALAKRLNAHHQVLCIVNTRKAAQAVYERLEEEGSFHLSTLMYPDHRKRQLAEIRLRLKEGLPCRVVSTSLMEAGVDVDFPAVFRELAGLDSILQAAGRCNREGKRSREESIVHIFEGEEKEPPLFSAAISAGREAMSRHEDIASQEAIHDYFSQLLDIKGEAAWDEKNILWLIQSEFFPFRTVAENFHLIDNSTRTLYIPLGEGAALVEQLRAGAGSRKLFRQLGQYGVSIYEKHFSALEEAGDLEILEDGSVILKNIALYSEKTGLSLEADSGKALFI